MMPVDKTYPEWEARQGLAGASPEGAAAEAAWNAALARAIELVAAATPAETTTSSLAALLHEELSALQTEYGTEFK